MKEPISKPQRAGWVAAAIGLVGLLLPGCATPDSRAPRMATRSAGDSELVGRVEAFVHRVHVHGVPYDQARQFDARAVPILEDLLADRREEAYWPNIVVTLAMVGDAEVGARLIEFIDRPQTGTLSSSAYAAKTGALMALGYLINHTGDRRSLDYLIQAASPDFWAARNLRWQSPNEPTPDGRNLQFATMAMLGLALSGHPDAVAALEAMQRPARDPRARLVQQARSEVLGEALKASRAIAADGLSEYYRKAGH
jgi:hypothetical protein